MKPNPYLAVIIAATVGASSGVFIKLLDFPATTISFFRAGVPVAILAVYFAIKKIKLFTGDCKTMMVASALNTIRILFYFLGYLFTTLGNAVIILFTWPVFAALFGKIFLKEKSSAKTFLLIGTAFAGVIIMYLNQEIGFNNRDFIGMASMLLSAVTLAFMMVIFKTQLKKFSKSESVFYQNFLAAIVFLPFVLFNRPAPTPIEAGVAAIYAFLVGIAGWLLFFYALKRLRISHYSLFTYWEVPAAIMFGVIFLGETVTANMVIGGSMIVVSGLLLRTRHRKVKPDPPE